MSGNNSPVKQALFAIKEMKARVAEVERARNEAIAIVGIGCRYPGGIHDPESFWEVLDQGRDAIGKIPASRFRIEDYYDPDMEKPGKIYTDQGGFVDDPDRFDADFFGIKPREAKSMDPQQRVVLEVCWEALEDAGIPGDSLKDSATGVYVGMTFNDYQQRQDHFDDLTLIDTYTGTGSYHNVVAGRVSYFLGLQGPCMVIDAACASSLATVHLGCQALRAGEVNLALAGGVHLMFSPDTYVALARTRALSPTGRCQTFSDKADGYIRSEGCGILVLKRVSDALRDGDRMYAIIRGSAVRQDGASSGLTVPSGPAQQELIRRALQRAGVSATDVSYVEAHGTGTPLGDPIEFGTLATVMGPGRAKDKPLVVSSVKTNIGHTEAAAGVAGIIKTVLALKHQVIPQHLHFEKPNSEIKLESIPAIVPVESIPWPAGQGRRIAGVSSFGFSGVIAHVVLEEAPEPVPLETPAAPESGFLLALSAASREALRESAARYSALIKSGKGALYDVCYNAFFRRARLPERLTVAGGTPAELIENLDAYLNDKQSAGLSTGTKTLDARSRIGLVFSGQGPQWWAMGRELLESEPVFRAKIEEIAKLLESHTKEWNLLTELQAAEDQSHLDQTEIAQPAIFALQVALATVLFARGVKPRAVVGHSVGEVAAAHISGMLSLEDSVKVVYHRARLMQAATGLGKMAAVDRPPEMLSSILGKYASRLDLGAHNSPVSSVLSGEEAALTEVLEILKKDGVPSKMLPVNYAFHSPQMEPFARELKDMLKGLSPTQARLTIYSTVRGAAAEATDYNAEYWYKNVRGAVRFAPAIGVMIADGIEAFIEISPHPVLANYVRQIIEKEGSSGIAVHTLRRGKPEVQSILATLGQLHCAGIPLEPEKIFPARAPFLELPKYTWQKKRYWLDFLDQGGKRQRTGGAGEHPFLGRRLGSPLSAVQFEAIFNAENPRFLGDHLLYGTIVVPGASHISMVLSAAREIFKSGIFVIESINFFEPVVVPDEEYRTVQLVFTPESSGEYGFKVFSCGQHDDLVDAENWTLHGRGKLRVDRDVIAPRIDAAAQIAEAQKRCGATHPGSEFYHDFFAAGYHLGKRFEWIADNWWREGEVLCKMEAPTPVLNDGNLGDFELYPSLIDSIFQLLTAGFPEGGVSMMFAENDGPGDIYVPFAANSFTYYGHTGKALWCHGILHEGQTKRLSGGNFREIFTGDLILFDEDGTIVADVKNINLKRAPREALLRAIAKRTPDWIYRLQWESLRVAVGGAPARKGKWLVFADEEYAAELGQALEKQGEAPILVVPGKDGFRELKSDVASYSINPGEYENFSELFARAFPISGPPCAGIAHFWSLRTAHFSDLNEEGLSGASELAYRSVLNLGQALGKAGWTDFPRLWLFTKGAQCLEGDADVEPLQSGLWGLGRVIALEYPDVRATLVDLDPRAQGLREIAPLMIAPPGDFTENQVALRKGQMYSARLKKVKLPSVDQELNFAEKDVCMITGGLGGLGLRVAQWLVSKGCRQLALVGRSEPGLVAKKMIADLEGAGARVHVVSGDIGTRAGVQKVMQAIAGTQGNLCGVFHAAGIVDDGMLIQQDWSRFLKVMAPKVQGTYFLHEATRNQPDLRHFVLFSSISGLLGTAGQANYALANTFMDGLAAYRRKHRLPALSIPWGPWAEVGMAAGMDEKTGTRWREAGLIGPDQGMELMGQLMTTDFDVAAVVPFRWPKYFEQFPAASRMPALAGIARQFLKEHEESGDRGPSLLQELEGHSISEKKELLVQHVGDQLRKVMGLDGARSLDARQGLFEMGLDSLMTVELRNRLQVTLGKPLSSTLTFDYPNIEAIAGYILRDVLEETEESALSPAVADVNKRAREENERLNELESMSDEDVEAMLSDSLAEFE